MMDVLVHPRLTFVASLHDMLGDAGTVKAG